jgi:hypothetical protein
MAVEHGTHSNPTRPFLAMPNSKDMVIFTQTYDLLMWLLPQCERFPKSKRFIVTQRLQGVALDFQEEIFEANARGGAQRLQHLQAATRN